MNNFFSGFANSNLFLFTSIEIQGSCYNQSYGWYQSVNCDSMGGGCVRFRLDLIGLTIDS